MLTEDVIARNDQDNFTSNTTNFPTEFESKIDIPVDYFYKMSMYDYGSPFQAVIREFFQNSVDAGSKNFIIFFDDEKREISFTDDGCGMDEDVIRNRLLVMGGSFKTSENAIGSFGHAKILIYFSWESYEIITNNLKVVGKSHLYSIYELPKTESIKGTSSKIKITKKEDYQKIKSSVKSYFLRCDTDVAVTMSVLNESGDFETERLEQNLKVEMPLNEGFDAFSAFIGNKFVDNKYHLQYVFVRSNGVYMFSSWISMLRLPIVIETKLSARDIFTQNRDSFKREYKNQFEALVTRVNNDNLSSVSHAYQAFISGANEPKKRRGREKKERTAYEHSPDFYVWGKTRAETNTYMRKIRAKRLLTFIKEFNNMFVTAFKFPKKIAAGFVFDKTVEGRIQNCNDHYILYVNPVKIEKFVQNKRQMIAKLVSIIKHELAHSGTIQFDDHDYHNEGYVSWYHKIDDKFWDQRVTEKLFNDCWNKFKSQ